MIFKTQTVNVMYWKHYVIALYFFTFKGLGDASKMPSVHDRNLTAPTGRKSRRQTQEVLADQYRGPEGASIQPYK